MTNSETTHTTHPITLSTRWIVSANPSMALRYCVTGARLHNSRPMTLQTE